MDFTANDWAKVEAVRRFLEDRGYSSRTEEAILFYTIESLARSSTSNFMRKQVAGHVRQYASDPDHRAWLAYLEDRFPR